MATRGKAEDNLRLPFLSRLKVMLMREEFVRDIFDAIAICKNICPDQIDYDGFNDNDVYEHDSDYDISYHNNSDGLDWKGIEPKYILAAD